MSKRKILTLALTLCMVAILAVGGTLAYFTAEDSAKNIMTLGGVEIRQDEKKQNGTDFVDNVPLLPATNTTVKPFVGEDGFFNDEIGNVVDKIVTVTNTATAGSINKDAYVRTILAFETADVYAAGTDDVIGDAHYEYIGTLGDFDYVAEGKYVDGKAWSEWRHITVDGVDYVLAVKVYEKALAAGATSEPSLKQLFMAPTANNEIVDLFDDEYTILALSQATQIAGFDSAEEALNTAFGDLKTMDAADIEAWFAAVK